MKNKMFSVKVKSEHESKYSFLEYDEYSGMRNINTLNVYDIIYDNEGVKFLIYDRFWGKWKIEPANHFEPIDIVEKRSEEHSKKTFLQDFLEKHPKAPRTSDGMPKCCPNHCGYTKFAAYKDCEDCIECWNRPMEE